jgi:hypothetical protein
LKKMGQKGIFYSMKRYLPILTALAAITTIVAFLISPAFRSLLSIELRVSSWLALLCLIAAALAGGFIVYVRRKPVEHLEEGGIVLPRPRLLASSDPNAVENVGVRFARGSSGTFSIWVYLQRNGEGIRALGNNRYMFAFAKNFSPPYKNVLAVAHGPMIKYDPPTDPSWKLWIANGKGDGHVWTYPDGGEFLLGWHLVLVRWDHTGPTLQLLIDGRVLISETGYIHLWPEEYPDRACLGCWPNKDKPHYANTYLARFRTCEHYVNDEWIQQELLYKPPNPIF